MLGHLITKLDSLISINSLDIRTVKCQTYLDGNMINLTDARSLTSDADINRQS